MSIKYNRDIHHRQSIRLRGYDYSQRGAYFLTLCTHNRECIFGKITNGVMHLNPKGAIVHQCWQDIPTHFPHVQLDEFVIMPNHLHGIIWIVGAPPMAAKHLRASKLQPRPHGTSKTIGSIVRGFKIGVTKWMRQNTTIYQTWQRNYWEHIIRQEYELQQIREYIHNNPCTWQQDKLYSNS
jgi:REP element-mobilizing transposase RayT